MHLAIEFERKLHGGQLLPHSTGRLRAVVAWWLRELQDPMPAYAYAAASFAHARRLFVSRR